jgi:D-sedoheptulose 7-phosphate isomerase
MSSLERVSSADIVRGNVADAIDVCEALTGEPTLMAIDAVVGELVRAFGEDGKVMLCGNGGSAADAQHLAAEFVGRFRLDRKALPAIALADNVAGVTAIGNDYSYDDVFVRGVQGFGRPGDVLIGLSTSGTSENVVRALDAANDAGLITVAFVGGGDCPMTSLAKHAVVVEGANTARIQEGHMLVGHTIVEIVERELCSQS